jgi:hypothetical protein
LAGELSSIGNHALDEFNKPILAMLASGAQFHFKAPAFFTEIGCHGSITIVVFAGTTHAFFLGLGIILGENIHIQRDKTAPVARNWGFKAFEHGPRTTINCRNKTSPGLIETLPQPLDRRNTADTKGLLEIIVLSH